MAGGTGLYIRAFCEGMDKIPKVPGEIRAKIISNYEGKGLQWLQNEVELKDAEFFKIGEIHNPQRLMRALEVAEATGKSILEFRKGKKEKRDFDVIKIGLELSKENLHRNIDNRVDKMIRAGIVDEAKGLLSYKYLNSLQTVGYAEMFDYLEGRVSLHDAVELIKKNTRQYAKRQITWFKKEREIAWFAPDDVEKMKGHLQDALH